MTGQFMACVNDPADERRMTVRNAAEGKECPLCAAISKDLQDSVSIRFDPAFMVWPVGAVDDGGKGMNVEMFLHVDGQDARYYGGSVFH